MSRMLDAARESNRPVLRGPALWLLCLLVLVPLQHVSAQQPESYARAEALIRQGHFDQGILILDSIIKAAPRNLNALNLLGIALTQKGDLPAANVEYCKALAIDPAFRPALGNLAANEFALKDYANAEKHFLAAAKLAPDDPIVNSFLGKLAYKRRDYASAARYLRKADSLFPQEPALAVALVESELEIGNDRAALAQLDKVPESTPLRARFQLALALATHNYFAEAAPYFEAVRAEYPDSYDAGFNLALCYVEAKQPLKAVDVLTNLKAAGHKTAELDNLLAQAYEASDQLQPSIDALREATQIAPEDEDNYLDLAALCSDHDALDLGLEVLEIGLHYRPQSDRLIFQRGILHAMKNQYDLAEQDFQLSSQLAPDKALTSVGLGVTYMQAGNLPDAIRTLRERAAQEPGDATLHYLLGDALIRSGINPEDAAFAEAKAALERSVQLNDALISARVDLAKLYLRENRVDEAVALLEKARALQPDEKSTYSQLAVAYRRQKKPEQAAAALATLTKLNEEQRARDSRGRTRLVRQDTSPNP